MTHSNRIWRNCIAAAGCAALLAGCSFFPSGQIQVTAPITAVPDAQTRGEVTVWSWNIAAKALQGIVPAFRKRNPRVHVNIQMTGANMQTRFMLSLAAGVGAPDVSELQLTDAPHYIATHRLADLTSVAANYKSMFPASRWDACTMNGRVYAIPWDMGPCAVFYKRDLFARYGIDPQAIETWDDYIKAGQVILQKSHGHTKMLPLGSNDLESMLEILLQQTKGQIFDAQGRIAVDSPQARQALNIIRRMRQTGICSDVAAYGQEWMAGFNDDSIATYPNAVWLAGTMKDSTADFAGKKPSWGVFRLPAVERGGLRVANMGGSVLVIPASCKNKEAAWSFVRYALCTTDGQLSQYRSMSLYPSFLPALRSQAMNEPDPFFDGQPVGRLFATDVTKIWRLNISPDWASAVAYIQQDLSHWAASGMPVDDGLFTDMAQKMHERLDIPISPHASAVAQRLPAMAMRSRLHPSRVRQA